MNPLYDRTKNRMKELGIKPDKALGQNFLISDGVVSKIVQAVVTEAPAHLLEVGPGLCALTDELLKMNLPLQLIELDRDFAKYWRQRSVEVIEDDALHVNWDALTLPKKSVLVSNLPYQISTHMVIDRCIGPENLESMILMFQKEVGEKLMGGPKHADYGFLSVMAQTFFEVDRLLEAGPKDFWPAPKIASQVLVFRRKTNVIGSGERAKRFLKFLKAGFSHRRKFLSKNLLSSPLSQGMTSQSIQSEFQEMNINPKARAEELSVEQFQKLFLRWA